MWLTVRQANVIAKLASKPKSLSRAAVAASNASIGAEAASIHTLYLRPIIKPTMALPSSIIKTVVIVEALRLSVMHQHATHGTIHNEPECRESWVLFRMFRSNHNQHVNSIKLYRRPNPCIVLNQS